MQVRNQLPQVLTCDYTPDPTADPFDPVADLRAMTTDALLVPSGSLPVEMADDAGNLLDADALADLFVSTLDDAVNVQAEADMRDLLSKCLVNYDASAAYPVRRLFVVQAAARVQLPLPHPVTAVYTPHNDVIPSAKDLETSFQDQAKRDTFFASLAYTFEPETTGVAFLDESAFDVYATFVSAKVAAGNPGDRHVTSCARELSQLSLKNVVVDGLLLRKTAGDDCQPSSFSRLIMAATLEFCAKYPHLAFMLPFDLSQYTAPEHLVFVNVDAHAHANSSRIMQAWNDSLAATVSPVRVVRARHLSKLSATSAAAHAARVAAQARSNPGGYTRVSALGISKTAPKPADICRRVAKVAAKLGRVAHSENPYMSEHRTYMRANRRHPDDPNYAGVARRTDYHPDIHLYVDTSGSITEDLYAGAVKTIIQLARKLNVNLYFTSFSHVMSESALISCKGRSAKQMWAQIHRLPKVTGGTDYEQIWRYIEMSPKRKKELSLIITDFEYCPPSARVKHPKRLWYAPCTSASYDDIRRAATNFVHSMAHIDPNIRRKLLF